MAEKGGIMDLAALEDRFTIREVAEKVGYQVSSIRYFLRSGILKGEKIKHKIYISEEEIMRFKNDYKGYKHSRRIEEN